MISLNLLKHIGHTIFGSDDKTIFVIENTYEIVVLELLFDRINEKSGTNYAIESDEEFVDNNGNCHIHLKTNLPWSDFMNLDRPSAC